MATQYNLFDPAVVDHHEDILTHLRHTEPVAEVLPGVFYVARHDDIVEVCRHPDAFGQGRFRPAAEDTRTEDQLNLGETDPPMHTRVRKILQSVLSPPAVRPFEPYMRAVCATLVDQFVGNGKADITAELGGPLPARVIGHVAGLPEELWPTLRPYSDAYIVVGNGGDSPERHAAEKVVAEFEGKVRTLIEERRRSTDRPPDVLTKLIEAEGPDGQPLSDDKILVHLASDMVVGGTETTTHLTGNLFYHLLSTPGAYERVRADRSLVANTVEETLRIAGPVQVLFRVPRRDFELRGVAIPAGSLVALGYASANHTESVFTCPEEFRPDRADVAKRHLGFGFGIHLCVGAPLARLELTCVLDAVLDRIETMSLAPGFEYERVEFFMMRGPRRLDVVFPAGGAAGIVA